MTMQLEGDLSLERVQTRRWVSIVAFVVPVAAFVLLVAWFVRVYIVPPTVSIPNLMMLASAPPMPPAPAMQTPVEPAPAQMATKVEPKIEPLSPQPRVVRAEPVTPRAAPERRDTAPALPMVATLAVVPLAINSAPPPAFSDPAQDVSTTASSAPSEPAALEPSTPIAGPIPLPHAKPHSRVAMAPSEVPLPRPRPVETTTTPVDLPVVDRHSID